MQGNCYEHLHQQSLPWLTILNNESDLSEYKSISKPLEEYNNQKSCAITMAIDDPLLPKKKQIKVNPNYDFVSYCKQVHTRYTSVLTRTHT